MCCVMLGVRSNGRGTFRESNRASHVHTTCWREADPFFATTRRTLSQVPVELRGHALAVVAGHVTSLCAYNGKTRRNTEKACWFCGLDVSPDFEHVMWGCRSTFQPICSLRPNMHGLQSQLGWSNPALTNEANRDILIHTSRVRCALVQRRLAVKEN